MTVKIFLVKSYQVQGSLLKSVLRCLNRAIDVNVKKLHNFIMSCFVLHYFCEFRNEKLPNDCLQNARVKDKILPPDHQKMKYGNVVNESSAKEIQRVFSM